MIEGEFCETDALSSGVLEEVVDLENVADASGPESSLVGLVAWPAWSSDDVRLSASSSAVFVSDDDVNVVWIVKSAGSATPDTKTGKIGWGVESDLD